MGSNVSKEDIEGTVVAYTLYGFGCSRCSNPPEFYTGSPQQDCCGTSCTRVDFDPPQEPTKQKALDELESHLDDAVEIAMKDITWSSHIFCSGFDDTAERASIRLNATGGWCEEQNEKLATAGLVCEARMERYGHGRSRVTYLVLRVFPLH